MSDIPENKVTKELIESTLKYMEKLRAKGEVGTGNPKLDRIIYGCIACKRDKRDKTTKPCNHCKPRPKYPDRAPDGQIFVCGACGKTSKSIYPGDSMLGWDESCMLKAVLCKEDSLEYKNGRVVKGDAVEGY